MIYLINMPFASVLEPNLALGVIKSQLTEAGIASRILDLNLDFGHRIGFGAYETIARFRGVKTQVGEWLFAGHAWQEPFGPPEAEFLRLCESEIGNIPHVADPAQWLLRVRREAVPAFLRDAAALLKESGQIRVVAFSCKFFQTIPSLALGRLIKQYFPDTRIVYGGACFHDEMGEELIDKAPWIDAVSNGEADDVIIPLFRALLDGRLPTGLQGIHCRNHNGEVLPGPPSRPVSADVVRSLPDPDFSDFFEAADRAGLLKDRSWQKRAFLPFESSRGCWWGQKHQCNFCGINGVGIQYRTRPGERVYETLKKYTRSYPLRRYRAVDNVLSMGYFKSLLTKLRDEPLGDGVEFYYEVKAILSRKQIKMLADAGVIYIQPGIESLSTHLLQLMGKGVSGLQNVFFLKCARQYGLWVYWNNLIRVPGESPEDYAQMADWMPKIAHLQPPHAGAVKIELHRFSPYFSDRGKWAENLRPLSWYKGLYPEHRVDLSRVAYYFDADWKHTLGGDAYDGITTATLEWLRTWGEEAELPRLVMKPCSDGGLEIEDTRLCRTETWQLDPIEASVYQAIDKPCSLQQVVGSLADTPGGKLTVTEVQAILEKFVDDDLALRDNGTYIALALLPGVVDPPLEKRSLYAVSIRNLCEKSP